MTGEAEAIGAFASASLAAHTLDRAAPGDAGHGLCANCGAAVDGRFCSQCGQSAHVHRSLIHVGHEFLHGITHFDGKAWKTLPMLLFRPGRLTRDYIYGKRARYVGPAPLFLFVIFLMFFVFSLTGNAGINTDGAVRMSPDERRAAIVELDQTIASLGKARAEAVAGKTGAGSLAATDTAIKAAEISRARLAADERNGVEKSTGIRSDELLPMIQKEAREGKFDVKVGGANFNARARHALENPELALYKIQGVAYKFAFLLVPLSLPWLWLLFFWKRGVRMYDHAVFALYSLSFMTLLVITVRLLVAANVENGTLYGVLVGLVPLAHMFVQLRGAYAIGTFGALWRTLTLALAAIITLSLYATVIAVLGLID